MTVGNGRADPQDGDQNREPTIRSRVMTLVAIVLLPFIGVMTWLATDYAKLQRRLIESERVAAVDILTGVLDREVAEITGALQGLAGSEDLNTSDFERFDRHAKSLTRLPDFHGIRVIDGGGATVYASAGASAATSPAPLTASIINRVMRGETVVSDIYSIGGSQDPLFSIVVPVKSNGQARLALSGDVRTSRFFTIFDEAALPKDWISAIIDRRGIFVARSLSAEDFVGKPARPELVAVAEGSSDRGEFENTTWEGTPTANSYHRSKSTGWTVVVAVPRNILAAPYRRSMAFVLIGSVTISLLSLAAAMLLAARISEPIRRLRDVATAIIEGRVVPENKLRIAELTEVRNALTQSVEKREHLAAIVTSSGDAIMSVGLDGRVRSWNDGAEKLFGYTAAEMIGCAKSRIVPDGKLDDIQRHIDLAKQGKSLRIETQRKNKDGKLIEVSLDMAPIRDANGEVIAMSSIMHNITERKATERHQRFLNRELTHRTKNLLAIVQSMARQTARSSASLQDFETLYTQRLQGLAASHDLLVNQNWVGAPLDQLIARQMDTFAEANRANIAIAGPDIMISAKAAQTIGLALHELATNSMKYGALSVPDGKVSIEWTYVLENDKPSAIEFCWIEHNGPAVVQPARRGFGSFVIERMAAQSLNAKVSTSFNPEGLVWKFTAPLDELLYEAEFTGGGTL